MLVRRVAPVSGSPRVRVCLRPRFSYGAVAPDITFGSNHIRYVGPDLTLRLTTDAPVDYVRDETAFVIEETCNFVLGPGRNAGRRHRLDRARVRGAHGAILARLGAHAGHPL